MKLSVYQLSQLETEFEAERIQQTKAHEIMTKYAIDPSCFSDLMPLHSVSLFQGAKGTA